MHRGAHFKEAYEIPENKIRLCRICHAEVGTIGHLTFAKKYDLIDRFELAEEKAWEKERQLKKMVGIGRF